MKKEGWFKRAGICLGSALLMGALLAGCGRDAAEGAEGTVVSSEEESGLTASAGSGGEASAVTGSSAEDAGTVTGSGSESTGTASDASKEDWSGRYEHYFEEHPLENQSISIDYEEQGQRAVIRCDFGQTEETVYVKYVFWCGKAGEELDVSEEKDYLTLYFLKSGEAYLETVMKGKETERYRAGGMDFANAEAVAASDNPLELGEDTFDDYSYEGEETIDGVVYDVLFSKTLRKTQSKANRWVKTYFYINRETQELEFIRVKDSTREMNCTVSPIDPAVLSEVPAEVKTGKKVKEDEFIRHFAISLVKITFHSMGYNPDKIDWEQMLGL